MATLPQLIEEDIAAIDAALQELLSNTDAGAALVIDKGGFLITQRGDTNKLDTTTLAALSAASYAATQGIANLVDEPDFSSIYQQGERFSLLVQNVDQYSLLTVVFKANISVGAVKYYAMDTIKKVAVQMKAAHSREPGAGLDLSVLNVANTAPLFQRKSA